MSRFLWFTNVYRNPGSDRTKQLTLQEIASEKLRGRNIIKQLYMG